MKKVLGYPLILAAVFAVFSLGGYFLAAEFLSKDQRRADIPFSEEAAPAVIPESVPAAEEAPPVHSPQAEIVPEAPVPEKEESFTFGVIGDTQYFKADGTGGTFRQAAGKMIQADPAFALAVGDLVSSCDGKAECENKLQSWKRIMGPLAEKSYVVMGNHDASGDERAEEMWRKIFNLPQNGPANFKELAYSFDHGNSHFVALNSDRPKEHVINEEQRTWLEKDLAAAKKENIFVFFHEPAFPVSSKIGESLDEEKKERDALWAILEKHKVTAVFNGHEHIHSRRKVGSIYQFGFGNTESFNHDMPKPGVAEFAYQGSHYGLVKVEGQKITVNVHSVGGDLINSFSFGE